MTNQDIIFASIVGNKLFKTSQNLILVQNNLEKRVLPTPPRQIKNNSKSVINYSFIEFENLNKSDPKTSNENQFFPLGFQFNENGLIWWFPYEPLISVKGSNLIERNAISKYQASDSSNKPDIEFLTKMNLNTGGTLKNIRQNDCEITITGILFGENERGNAADCYPRHDLQKLAQYLTSKSHIRVYSPVFELLEINNIVIEAFSFPFTKGENTQAYEIKAFSDSGKYKMQALNGTF
jgi:hypothetical protein